MTFDQWFKAQFGRLPLPMKHRAMWGKRFEAAIGAEIRARQMLDDDESLWRDYRAAQYGWNITDADKKKAKP